MDIEGPGFVIPGFGGKNAVHGATVRCVPTSEDLIRWDVTMILCGCMDGNDMVEIADSIRDAANRLERRGKSMIARMN